jgi:septal ring factor EnvC (AmiA/AmiB activator)
MVNAIRDQAPGFSSRPRKKKVPKGIDQRVRKAAKQAAAPQGTGSSVNATLKVSTNQARLTAEKAYASARQKAIATKQAALRAQKAAFLAQRAHMARQADALKKARAAEKAKKDVKKAEKKASTLRKVIKV